MIESGGRGKGSPFPLSLDGRGWGEGDIYRSIQEQR